MPNVAIICELNPLHNGHAALFRKARELSVDEKSGKCGIVAAVMSGNFVQRGDVAICDKWARTRMALGCGADIVLEIPSCFGVASAQFFAEAGVAICERLGIFDVLLFGSECGDIDYLKEMSKKATLVGNDKPTIALPRSIENNIGVKLSSNDILGIEYIKALNRLNSKIEPVCIKRVGGALENDLVGADDFAGAVAIRKLLCEGNFDEAKKYMPDFAFDILAEAFDFYGNLPALSDLESTILTIIRTRGLDYMVNLPFAGNGLGAKIYSEVLSGGTLSEIIENTTSNIFTKSRVRRTLISALIGGRADDLDFNTIKNVPYVRILGIKADKKSLLGALSERTAGLGFGLVVGNFTKKDCKGQYSDFVLREILATDLLALSRKNSPARKCGQELSSPLIVV